MSVFINGRVGQSRSKSTLAAHIGLLCGHLTCRFNVVEAFGVELVAHQLGYIVKHSVHESASIELLLRFPSIIAYWLTNLGFILMSFDIV